MCILSLGVTIISYCLNDQGCYTSEQNKGASCGSSSDVGSYARWGGLGGLKTLADTPSAYDTAPSQTTAAGCSEAR